MIVTTLIAFLVALPLWGGPTQPQQQLPAEPEVRVPVVGISTNALYDLTWVPGYGVTSIPSFSLEYYPRRSGHWTFGVDAEWPMWKHPSTHKYMQINNLTLWTRRYFRTRARTYEGLYLLGNVNAARYGIGFDERGWEGEGAGASLGVGYKRILGKSRWYVDTGVALGAFLSRQDPYIWGNDAKKWYYYDYWGDPDDFKKRNQRFFWVGPTRIYVSVGIELFGKRKR